MLTVGRNMAIAVKILYCDDKIVDRYLKFH